MAQVVHRVLQELLEVMAQAAHLELLDWELMVQAEVVE
jgi:hypothetical protein